jgi:AbrB family looped-hinge helix DNA binding protein
MTPFRPLSGIMSYEHLTRPLMNTTRLSSKGQVVLPSSIRAARKLKTGARFAVEDTREGILLRPLSPFPQTRIEDVCGMLEYDGPARSIEEMDAAVSAMFRKRWRK